MTASVIRGLFAALLASGAAGVVACSSAVATAGGTAGAPPHPAALSASDSAAIARARADSVRHPYTAADIHFMSAMIGHHAQAIHISGWARSHGANPAVQRLAERIINAQQDEIRTMQTWLRDRQQDVPDAQVMGMRMTMDGVEHVMLMPGMLTRQQMAELDRARGEEFDRLFLTDMIQHHRGAVSMVRDLFGSYGAAQDELVFKFANDVNVDQTTEIARMQRMLANITLTQGTEQ